MKKSTKVIFILGTITLIAILIAIFALNGVKKNSVDTSKEEFERKIELLSDSIYEMKVTIEGYRNQIEDIESEKSALRDTVKQILKDNEKIDAELSNGDWDYNLRFLSEYFSKKDSIGK